ELFKTIEETHPELTKIYIVSDNARYYYSRVVREYLRHSRIELMPLPSYSPNLNLIEPLWKFFKKTDV
ncbi:MAG TPA: IS630 family transposase, partial [Spirochaetes bacterium]|nr:IS630 family transposase [Spirochaetota bacterium]